MDIIDNIKLISMDKHKILLFRYPEKGLSCEDLVNILERFPEEIRDKIILMPDSIEVSIIEMKDLLDQ